MTIRPLDSEQKRSLAHAAETFQAALLGSPAAEHLRARGISLDTAERFRLGYVAEPIPGFEHYVGRLAIPNLCGGEDPHPVGMTFRALQEWHDPKYLLLPMPTRMFNARAINEADRFICITEGEMDAITLGELGLPAIAISGSSGWKSHYWRVLEGFERIVLFRDNDEAGLRFENSIRKTELPLVSFIPPGVGMKGDVNESYLLGHGDEIVSLAHGTHKNGATA